MDIYHSKIGDFWLEADGKRVPFKLIAKFKNSFYRNYTVLDRKVFKPLAHTECKIGKLALKTNIDLAKFIYNDIISDEFVYGYDVVGADFKVTFGTAVFTSNWDSKYSTEQGTFYEDNGNFRMKALPSYLEVDDVSNCRFSFAYREFKSRDDLSVDFACDFNHPKREAYAEYISDLAYEIVATLSKNERNEILKIKDRMLLEKSWLQNKYRLYDSKYSNHDVSADVVKLVLELFEENH